MSLELFSAVQCSLEQLSSGLTYSKLKEESFADFAAGLVRRLQRCGLEVAAVPRTERSRHKLVRSLPPPSRLSTA